MSYFVHVNVLMHTWQKGLKLPPKTLVNFFITFGKSHHPASKDSIAWWVKEVIGNSGMNTEIFKSHSTRVASNSAAYKLGVPLQGVLKRGQRSNAGTFFTYYYFSEIEDSFDLDKQQDTWWVICCVYIYIYIYTYLSYIYIYLLYIYIFVVS